MKTIVVALALFAASAPVMAADPQDGFGSVTDITAQADGRFKYNDTVLSPKKLKDLLVELDRQLHIDRINLRAGATPPTEEQIRQVGDLSTTLHAELFVERDGTLKPVSAPPGG